MEKQRKTATLSLGAEWDRAKELSDETILSASGFVRQLIREYGEELKQKYKTGEINEG